jgi:hypothetical protein
VTRVSREADWHDAIFLAYDPDGFKEKFCIPSNQALAKFIESRSDPSKDIHEVTGGYRARHLIWRKKKDTIRKVGWETKDEGARIGHDKQ